MVQPAPDWISFDAEITEGLDLLGLRAPVQRIGNQLFNGVNTVTPKVRYLSVLAWIVWRYSRARLPNSWNSFISFAKAQEAMIVMANRLKSRAILNLVGVIEADKRLDTGKRTLPLKGLAQNAAYNIYVTTSRQLHLTHDEASAFGGLTKERGLRLAEAFDQVIRDTPYDIELTKRPRLDRISRTKLEELSGGLFLDRIPRAERDILIDAVIPLHPETTEERSRLANYALLLWLSEAKGEEVEEGDVFGAATVLPRSLPHSLLAVLNGWLEYIVRDVLAVTHEAVFEAVMRQIDISSAERGAPAMAADVVAALVDQIGEYNSILRQLGLLRLNETIKKMSFSELRERIRHACREKETVHSGLRRWHGGLSETTLYEMALKSDLATAVFLPVAWCLAAERVAPELFNALGENRRILSIGGVFQIGLEDVVIPKLEAFVRENRTVLEVMAELTTRTVQQHLRVAWTRFAPAQGKDVSVIIVDGDTWARQSRFMAGRTDSRLWAAISWLRQLGLIGEDGVTKRGKLILDRSLAILGSGLS